MAKIVSLSTEIVVLPLEFPLKALGAQVNYIDNVVVHVDTDDGVRGSGYVWFAEPRAEVTPRADGHVHLLAAAVRFLEPIVVGEDVFAHERLYARARAASFQMSHGLLSVAHSGIDMAMWDAKCKTIGQPLYRVLGAARGGVPYYTNELLSCTGAPPEVFAEKAEQLVAAGWTSLKMPAGLDVGEPETLDLDRLLAVREAVGENIGLMLDVGGRWTLEQNIKLGARGGEVGLRWLEDPLPLDQLRSLARLRAHLRSPIATGEMACSPVELDALLGHVDLLIFEPMRVGGITGSLKVAAMAEAAGVPVAVHTYPDLAAHLMLAAPNGMTAEYLSWWEGMFSQPIACTGASAMPLDEPGIGFTFDPDALRRHGIPSA